MTAAQRGREAFVATDADRTKVRDLVAGGKSRGEIAAALGVSLPTLRKYFGDDLSAPPADEPAGLFSADAIPRVDGGPATPGTSSKPRPAAGGRPAFNAALYRDKVALLAGVNTPHAEIARIIGITEPTLRKYFKDELSIGPARKKAENLEAMFRSARKGNVSAQRALHDILERAELERLDEQIVGRKSVAPRKVADQKPETPGKKQQALIDARDIAESDEWRGLLKRPTGSSTMPN